jgi:hypothetical protein
MMGDPVANRNVLSDCLAVLRTRREKGGGIVLNEHVTAVDTRTSGVRSKVDVGYLLKFRSWT